MKNSLELIKVTIRNDNNNITRGAIRFGTTKFGVPIQLETNKTLHTEHYNGDDGALLCLYKLFCSKKQVQDNNDNSAFIYQYDAQIASLSEVQHGIIITCNDSNLGLSLDNIDKTKLMSESKDLQEKNRILEDTIRQLQSQDLGAKSNAIIENLQKNLTQLTNEKAELEAAALNQNIEIANNKTTIASMEVTIASMEVTIADLQNQLQGLQERITPPKQGKQNAGKQNAQNQ